MTPRFSFLFSFNLLTDHLTASAAVFASRPSTPSTPTNQPTQQTHIGAGTFDFEL
jgi:hypothetical protein